jgi:NAD(P)-dependent dehydrogenase (short-subunit alcohol dehydrogenase family)
MDVKLKGKNAIVTGGSAGIGFACAKALVEEGTNVMIVGRNQKHLEEAVEKLRKVSKDMDSQAIIPVSGNLSEANTVNGIIDIAISQLGSIDILVNNAGSAPAGSFLDLKDEDFIESWNLKLLGYIRMIRAVAPHMMQQKDGKIINIIGSAGRTPSETFLPGSTTNAALINFTKGISKELARYNVRINAISPGVTSTERANKLAHQRASVKGISIEEEKKEVLSSIPLGNMVHPDEIAAFVLLLASNLVPSITGSEIVIDGGAQPGI